MKEVYLGDGAYAKWDGFTLLVYTSNGVETLNRVYLEADGIATLKAFLGKIKS